MASNPQIFSATNSVEALDQVRPGNLGEAGWWRRFALAAEGLAGDATIANETIEGWMLRAALALEAMSGTSGAEENSGYEGLLKRIVDALEGGSTGTGSLGARLMAAALAYEGGASPSPSTISAPVLALAVGTTTYPPQFDISFDDTPDVGDTLRVQWANPGQAVDADGVFTATVGGVDHVITSGEAAANAASIGLSSISSGTYQYQAYVIRGSDHSPASNNVEHGPDITPPVLSGPTAASTGTTSAAIGVTTETPEGTLYYVLTTSATAPSKAQVKAGQNHTGAAAAWAGSQAISSTGEKTAGPTGLTANTTYYAYFMHEDATGNQSTVTSAASFATDAASPVTQHAANMMATVNKAYGAKSHTFAAVGVGTEQTNRVCIVGVALYDGGTNQPSGVTIGGVAATKIAGAGQMSLWRAAVPVGATADVVVTSANNIGWVGGSLVAIRTGSPVQVSTVSDAFAADATAPSVTPTTPTDGITIAFAAKDNTGVTAAWSGATAQGFSNNLVWSIGIATRLGASSATITAGGFGGSQNGLLTASFGP